MAWFYQHDRITATMPLMDIIASYPKNIEFLSLWIFKFSGNDQFVDGVNLLFHLAVIPFAYGVGQHVGLKRAWAFTAACIYFLTPNLILQSWSTYVDQALADSMVMVLFFYVSWLASPVENKSYWSLLLGLGLGHIAHTKGTALHAIGVLGSILVIRELVEKRARQLAPHLTIIVATTIITGSGWYFKNWYVYGNPVYPFELTFPGTDWVMFPGSMSKPLRVDTYISPWPPIRYFTQFAEPQSQVLAVDNRGGGWGPHFFFLGLPALVVALLRGNRSLRTLVIFTIAYFVVLQPLSFWARHSLIIAFAGSVAFASLVQDVLPSRPWHRVLTALSCFLLILGLIPTIGVLSYAKPQYMERWGGQRFTLVNHQPGAKIGIVNVEFSADNPLWYFYFGPKWSNKVEEFDPKKVETYDYIICALISNKCSHIRESKTHHSLFIEKNIEVFSKKI
jgi:hypothetical protein